MPDAARRYEQSSATPPNSQSSWSIEPYGEVGAMHRTIEQRLLFDAFNLAVIPLQARPLEKILDRVSRASGWVVLVVAAIAAVGAVITHLV